jgi:apolipoprotein D and lipocalin family protein
MFKYDLLIFFTLSLTTISNASLEEGDVESHLPTVDYVDLDKFGGVWYEIARLPTWDEMGCLCTVSTYTHLLDNSINVLHECLKDGVNGQLIVSTGKGWAIDQTNSKLRFDYKWPFWTFNYIIEIDKNYGWAMIGHPNRNKLWIFSRCPELAEETYKKLVDRAMVLEFPVQKLIKTYQGDKCIYLQTGDPKSE